MSEIPIVFIHTGYQEYLKIALWQAKSFNPTTEIILIGDESNLRLNKICKHFYCEEFSAEAIPFENHFVHFSTNSYAYEIFCIKRWFLLLTFMKSKNLKWVFAADTDVLIYSSIKSFFNENIKSKDFEAAFCIPKQEYCEMRWVASPHTSFISITFLIKFCNYILDIYKTNLNVLMPKIENHKKESMPGGINDMTFFYLYFYNLDQNVLNLLIQRNNKIFNINVGMKSNKNEIGFDSISWKKKIFFKKRPYFKNSEGQQVFFETLHMHGGSKNLMGKFYTRSLSPHYLKSILGKIFTSMKTKITRLYKYFK
jgi:hypothetical protein